MAPAAHAAHTAIIEIMSATTETRRETTATTPAEQPFVHRRTCQIEKCVAYCRLIDWRRLRESNPTSGIPGQVQDAPQTYARNDRAMTQSGSKKGDDTQRRKLYSYGMSDREIAQRTDVSRAAIKSWRRSRALPANNSNASPKLSKSEQRRRMQFYRRGYCDFTLAQIFDLTKAGVVTWREARGLPINKRDMTQPRLAKVGEDRRLVLYRRGLSDVAIAKEIGSTPNTISRWRYRRGLTLNEKGVKWDRPATTFVSLDADLSQGGFNRHGLIADDAASEWLEENGATKW